MSNLLSLQGVALAVERIRQDVKGAIAINGWLGDGGHPVEPEQAEARAATCIQCPQNVRRRKVENRIAEEIRQHEEVRSKINLRTSQDINLHNCVTCGCYLKLKVWVPLKNQTEAAFPDNCWIVKEKAAEKKTPDRVSVNGVRKRDTISIRRTDAFGDVIMASILATKLHERGYEVDFSASKAARTCLYNHPHISSFLDPVSKCDIDLDGVYENSVERTKKDIALLMLESGAKQLNIGFDDFTNRVPVLGLTDEERDWAFCFLQEYKRPWTAIIPKSASWPNRTILHNNLGQAARMLPGTAFWAFPGSHPSLTVPVPIRTFRDLMAIIAEMDLVITPDTGPLHVASAFNRKVILAETCNLSHLRITDLTDYSTVSAPVGCIGCGHMVCPIDAQLPPCSDIPGHTLAHAALQKLSSMANGKVSAIIPVYRFDERLMRCIDAIRDQVDEIIVSLDGDAWLATVGPKVKVVQNVGTTRTGYGKTCMRAARHAVGEFLLMLNDDCYLKPGAVQAMKDAMQPQVAVVGAQLWYPDGTLQHGGMGRRNGDIGFGHIDHLKRVPSITSPVKCESVTFAAALVRRSAFFQVRGFDQRYDCYSEDTDLCMKVRQNGWQIVYQPNAVGIHDESQSTSPIKERLLKESSAIFRSKWGRYFHHNPLP